MLNVIWLSIDPELIDAQYWDQSHIKDILDKFKCRHHRVSSMPEDVKNGIVVIPARNQADYIEQINDELAKLEWVIVILSGDEESVFDWRKLKHDRLLVWAMSPKQGVHDDAAGKIGSGYRQETRKLLGEIGLQEPSIDIFFAGQVTHPQREACVEAVKKLNSDKTKLIETDGFGKGISYREYLENMARSKFVACPAGPCTPDTFRLFEALEAGCIPIADGDSYWPYLFGESLPFPILSTWESLPDLLPQLLKDWPQNSNKVFAWWQLYKRKLVDKLEDQITTLSRERPERKVQSDITVLIPVSPVPTHPSTEIIDETIASVRERLPDSEIIIMFDACSDQKIEMKAAYEEFKHRTLWKIANELDNVTPLLFSTHSHQSLMTKEALKLVRTNLVLFVEQDCPLHNEIPFNDLIEPIKAGYANVIRLHFEAQIPQAHEYLMLDKSPIDVLGVPLIRTRQWSGRPHLASTKFYRYIADKYLDDQPRFIEHAVYGIVVHGEYDEFRLHIFAPEGTLVRSLHLDGRRKGAKVYDPSAS